MQSELSIKVGQVAGPDLILALFPQNQVAGLGFPFLSICKVSKILKLVRLLDLA